MPKVLYVHGHLSRFVQIDRDLLAERWEVREWHQRSRRIDWPGLFAAVRSCDVVFGWFASWHTFGPVTLAWLLGKPIVQVSGGYDVANMPEIGYGHQRGGLRRWMSRWVIRRATRLLTNSYYSRHEIVTNLGLPLERIRVLYHGVPDPLGALPSIPRKPMVLTVGAVDHSNLIRKGHRAFVRAARLLPDMMFVLAGKWQDDAVDELKRDASPNVLFTDWVDDATLTGYLRQAMVYVQASQHEGFGMAVAEAMLAGCIPVVTRAGALPEVVGNTGVYLADAEPETIANGIREAVKMSEAARTVARERVTKEFSLAMRGAGLHALVEEALADGRRTR
jgi:glycosyltransferase involved in cell wall biosynthesis